MITRIRAENFRCLRSVDVPLRPFQILIGPNGSGKSAFMDALAFVRTLTNEYLDAAVKERTDNFHDLVWGREGNRFSLSLEAAPVPSWQDGGREHRISASARYDLAVRVDIADEAIRMEEKITVRRSGEKEPLTVAVHNGAKATYHYEREVSRPTMDVDLGRIHSVLNTAPVGEKNFPEALWLREAVAGIYPVKLKLEDLRAPSPPFQGAGKTLTGSYLARFVAELQDKSPELFRDWIAHLQTCVPDLETVRTEPWAERHRYLTLRYKNGLEIPSWLASDGTLRLLALTVLAYLPIEEGERIYLIEEPENGVHPTAVDAIYQSLSSVYDGQVLIASHSPMLVAAAKPEELLCFSRTADGTQVIAGDKHPRLRDWKGEVNLSEFFAAGVLD